MWNEGSGKKPTPQGPTGHGKSLGFYSERECWKVPCMSHLDHAGCCVGIVSEAAGEAGRTIRRLLP